VKPRHAAALALVGWYLMTPPPDNVNAPISQWDVGASYDSADQCTRDLNAILSTALARGTKRIKAGLPVLNDDPERRAQCIATDDPRLKEK
jgi:hypothetical protein